MVAKKHLKLPKDVLDFFRATGAEGGKERAKRLSAKQRSDIARKAVKARIAKAKEKSSS